MNNFSRQKADTLLKVSEDIYELLEDGGDAFEALLRQEDPNIFVRMLSLFETINELFEEFEADENEALNEDDSDSDDDLPGEESDE